ncbi:hypothetical protein RY27_19960 [Litorilinea aerophila]|nr:hypothetical protein RY27_19960 [Litorilinea aerophila]
MDMQTIETSGRTAPSPEAKPEKLLYELCLSIDVSLDARAMFAQALAAIQRHLHCSAVAVYLLDSGLGPCRAFCALPESPAENVAVQVVEQFLAGGKGQAASPVAWWASLPRQGETRQGGFYHLLPLEELGWLVLTCPTAPLDAALLQSLAPILRKLAQAGQACLQRERIEAAYSQTLWVRNIYRSLMESIPSIVLAMDAEGRFQVVEGSGLKHHGIVPEELLGRSVFELYSYSDVLEHIRAAFAGETRRVMVRYDHRSYDTIYRPVIQPDGQVHGVICAAHDVSARQDAIDTLTAVLNTVDEGVVTTDEQGVINLVNAQVTHLFDYPAEELVGQPLWILLAPLCRPTQPVTDLQDFLDTKYREDPRYFLDLQGITRGGRVFPVEMRIQPFQLAERRQFTVSIRDITERKEYERLRDDFVSTVSHELRTPLASIMGWTETLLTEHPGPLNDLQHRFLEMVYASSQRLDKLIEELLTVSRIQRGTLRLKVRTFEPQRLVQEVCQSLAPQLASRGLQLIVEDDWPAGHQAEGDPERLEQVLRHLLSNAIKFSQDGQEVRVRSRYLDGAWHLEVQDQGIGVSAEEIPLIFQRFYRGQAARQGEIPGTGLGLYLARAIVEAHGGRLIFQGVPGQGTHVECHTSGQ